MANYSFEDYENAILAALAPLTYLKTLAGYAGELDDVQAMERFRRGFPGVLVEVAEAAYEIITMPYYYQEVTINLLVGDRSYRSQDDARGGDTGVYRILRDIQELLLGNTLGLEIRPIVPVRDVKLGSSVHTVLYLAEYRLINDRIEEL